jgi:hypothetical protein
MPVSKSRPKEFGGQYALRGSYRMMISTGAVTTIAAATATAGHLFAFRWVDSTVARCFLRLVTARFILTTAYGAAQETGCDLIVARGYSASHTGATAVDVGGTVASTGKLMTSLNTSLMATGSCRVAGAGALTAGTHALDANPLGVLSDWSSAVGATVPTTSSGAQSAGGILYDARGDTVQPLVLAQNEGFIIRNLILMGATGVGRWDFVIEWDEGQPE